jgi:hypothetical protein
LKSERFRNLPGSPMNIGSLESTAEEEREKGIESKENALASIVWASRFLVRAEGQASFCSEQGVSSDGVTRGERRSLTRRKARARWHEWVERGRGGGTSKVKTPAGRFKKRGPLGCTCSKGRKGNPKYGSGICFAPVSPTVIARREWRAECHRWLHWSGDGDDLMSTCNPSDPEQLLGTSAESGGPTWLL